MGTQGKPRQRSGSSRQVPPHVSVQAEPTQAPSTHQGSPALASEGGDLLSEITPYLDGPISFVARKLEASSTFQHDSGRHILPGEWNLKTQADSHLLNRTGQ